MAEQPPQKEKTPLGAFREEMSGYKKEEMRKKAEFEKRGSQGERYDPHFDDINPEHLTEDDMAVWEKTKNKTLTRKELQEYLGRMSGELKSAEPQVKKSRGTFYAFIANKAAFIVKRELEAMGK